MYYHKFEIRWNDLDANRHLANSSYIQYATQTRMAFMQKHRLGLAELNRWGIGSVILHESVSFFNEVYLNQELVVGLELAGFSEDGGVYEFEHRFYLPNGIHCATSQVLGVWIDTMLRKATTPPDDVLVVFEKFRTEHTKVLTREDIKNLPSRPQDINPEVFMF